MREEDEAKIKKGLKKILRSSTSEEGLLLWGWVGEVRGRRAHTEKRRVEKINSI